MLTGSCNCSGVRFEIHTAIDMVVICHCSICRKSTGTNGIAVVLVANQDFHWTRGQNLIKSWEKPGHDWQKCFCEACGSPLPAKNDNERMFVPAGLLNEDIETLEVKHHIWVNSKAGWDQIGDMGIQHPEAFGSTDIGQGKP